MSNVPPPPGFPTPPRPGGFSPPPPPPPGGPGGFPSPPPAYQQPGAYPGVPTGYVAYGQPGAGGSMSPSSGLGKATIVLFWLVTAASGLLALAFFQRKGKWDDFLSGSASIDDLNNAD